MPKPPPSAGPFLIAKDSVSEIVWSQIFAILPLAGISIWAFGLKSFWIFLGAVFSCLISDSLAKFFLKRNLRIRDGHWLLTGLLIFLVMPSYALWWHSVLGGFFAIWVGRELFGGIGQQIFHPVLMARAWLFSVFPSFGMDGMIPSQGPPLVLFYLALSAGGFFLIRRQILPWRLPFYYLGTVVILSYFWEGRFLGFIFLEGLGVAAIFYLHDFASLPTSGRGRTLFAFGAGVLTAVIRRLSGEPGSETYGILLMNAFVPVIERYVRPHFFGEARKRR